jgi:CHASE3 domain sensor protein
MMNRALKFRRTLWGVATVVIAILAFAFFLALRSALQAESVFDWSAHTEEVLDKIGQARFGRSRLMNQLWSFRVTRRPDLPAHFHDDMENLHKNLQDLRTLTADNPKQVQILNELTPLIAAQLISLQKGMDDAIAGNASPADSSTWSLPFQPSDRVRDLFNILEKDERTLLAERSAAVRANVARTRVVLIIACALTVLILSAWFKEKFCCAPQSKPVCAEPKRCSASNSRGNAPSLDMCSKTCMLNPRALKNRRRSPAAQRPPRSPRETANGRTRRDES